VGVYNRTELEWTVHFQFFFKSKATEVSMIADGIIPYLVAAHGDQVLQFFAPEAVVNKAEWSWDAATKTIVNPLSRELNGLESMDNEYAFCRSGCERY